MAKVVRAVALVAAIAVNVIPGVGQAISAGIFATLGVTVAATTALALTTVAIGAVAASAGKAAAGRTTLGAGSTGLTSRVSVDPGIRQWLVIGETALPTQLIYFGTSGASNENLSMVFAHACHPIAGFTGLNLNNIATAFPTPSGAYAGILSIETADGTQTANPFTSVNGGEWGAAQIGRGLAMSHFRWTYDQAKLASGLPQNVQFIGKGQKVYDPRRDSTRGGSGSHRADNEATWAYAVSGDAIGRNPALVELSYRLGWRKAGRLWAGMGEDPANIDYASYIAAANICDETVGGKPRYRIDGLLSLGDIHNVNLGKILAACAGKPLDSGGLIGIWVGHDDTAAAAMTIGVGDWVGDIGWQPLPEGEVRNTARGQFIDPASFYQAQPYIQVQPSDLVALDNGEELVDTLDFAMVQDSDQARRLASIRLRESRQGKLMGPTALKSLGLRPSNVVAVNHPRTGWTARRFRVETMALAIDKVQLAMRAVQSSDYADVANMTMYVPGSLPTVGYIPVLGVLAYRDFVDFQTEVAGAEKPENNATQNPAGDAIGRNDSFEVWENVNQPLAWSLSGPGIVVRQAGSGAARRGNTTAECIGANRMWGESFPVKEGEKIWLESAVRTTSNATTGISVGSAVWWLGIDFATSPVDEPDPPSAAHEDLYYFAVPVSAGIVAPATSVVVPMGMNHAAVFAIFEPGNPTSDAVSEIDYFTISRADPLADETAAQPIVQLLSPATGRALAGFVASDGTPFMRIVETGEARDGDVVTFATTYPAAPQMVFFYGGAAATAGNNVSIRFEGLTGSGFTFRAKSQSVTVGSTVTDTGATAGGGGEPTLVINRTNGSAPFDGRLIYSLTVGVGDVAPGEPGRIRVGLFAKQSGAWVQVGLLATSVSDSYSVAVTPGAVDFGSGTEFGVSVLSATGAGTALSSFDSVAYTPGTVSESSLTPSSASPIRWEARL